MKNRFLFLVFLFASIQLIGQVNPRQYEMTCYCSARETPHSIVAYDNNLQLIIAFKNGLSKKGLDSLKIPYTNSQLKLLRIYKLIRMENNKYYSTIPVLDTIQTANLRIQSKIIADKISPVIEKDLKNLVAYLNSVQNSRNTFSVVFSYVLDGLTWHSFSEKEIIKPFNDNNLSPWNGYFWMLAPKRKETFGTNSQSDSTLTFSITHGPANNILESFYYEDDLLQKMLQNIREYGKVSDQGVISTFSKFNIVDEQGKVLVPIIIENGQNELFRLSLAIAVKISDYIIANAPLTEIKNEYNLIDEEQTVIILYHEILWDLLDNIEAKGIIDKPLIFKNPEKATTKDISDLIFFIKQ